MTDIQLPEGRIVQGHPMRRNVVTDDNNNPKMNPGGTQITEVFFAFAIAKNPGETDWKQTNWGSQISAVAAADFPNGETQMPAFSWKVEDGDSQVPNKNMKKNCDREGFPGNWVLKLGTRLSVRCYADGKFNPMAELQDQDTIQCGDYGRAMLSGVKGNGAKHPNTPGMYLNPSMFSLDRKGTPIVSEGSGPSAMEVWGGGAAAPKSPPVNTAKTPATGIAPPPTAVAPAPSFLAPPPPAEKRYNYQGGEYTEAQLIEWGWTAAQISGLDDIPS